jgi:hypothetical protein
MDVARSKKEMQILLLHLHTLADFGNVPTALLNKAISLHTIIEAWAYTFSEFVSILLNEYQFKQTKKVEIYNHTNNYLALQFNAGLLE